MQLYTSRSQTSVLSDWSESRLKNVQDTRASTVATDLPVVVGPTTMDIDEVIINSDDLLGRREVHLREKQGNLAKTQETHV